MNVSLLGVTFHLYGLLVGIAAWVGYGLSKKQATRHTISEGSFTKYWLTALLSGVVGARLYYLFTDQLMLAGQFWSLLTVWTGGLSIIGGVLGGMSGLWLILQIEKRVRLFPILLDCAVFGLPFAQAIGRLGNYVNQELYGLPTSLPWGIPIDPVHRLNGYEQFNFFHPLFAYEAVAMILFGGLVWYFFGFRKKQMFGFSLPIKIGEGTLFLVYVFYYSIIRFLLDFIRIDKTHFLHTNLGINQVLLVFGMLVTGVLLHSTTRKKYAQK